MNTEMETARSKGLIHLYIIPLILIKTIFLLSCLHFVCACIPNQALQTND